MRSILFFLFLATNVSQAAVFRPVAFTSEELQSRTDITDSKSFRFTKGSISQIPLKTLNVSFFKEVGEYLEGIAAGVVPQERQRLERFNLSCSKAQSDYNNYLDHYENPETFYLRKIRLISQCLLKET